MLDDTATRNTLKTIQSTLANTKCTRVTNHNYVETE